jgi:hypothetical protein
MSIEKTNRTDLIAASKNSKLHCHGIDPSVAEDLGYATEEEIIGYLDSSLPIVLADPELNKVWHEQQAKAKLDAEQEQSMDERGRPLTIAEGKENARQNGAKHNKTKRAEKEARKPLAKPYNPQ